MAQTLLHLIEISDRWKQRILEVAPEMVFVHAGRSSPEFAQVLREADIVLGSVKIHQRSEAPKLKWIQLPHAGAEGWQQTPAGIRISTGAGVYGVPIAEHLFALMLGLTRGVAVAVRAMEGGEGTEGGQWKTPFTSLEVAGSTALVVGFGDIGQQFARRAKAFGMYVIAMKRTPAEKPDYVDELVTIGQLHEMLPRADQVVISLPGTSHTRHLFDAAALERMKRTAFIYNVGRGSVIDETALVAALVERRIAGAGLDVFETEPLPPDSPLWRMKNVIITPHRAGSSPRRDERLLGLFVGNLRAYIEGKPLRSEFRPEWGY